jgi:uncharacterized protein YbaR (Trm112 family)
MSIDPELMDILACPQCHSSLSPRPSVQEPVELVCTEQSCGLRFPVRDGIPILLIDEASPSGE